MTIQRKGKAMIALEQMVKELETFALKEGATSIKLIHSRDVAVAQWVRTKCQFGCRHYGKRFSCPPYTFTPEETARNLREYSSALLVEFGNLLRDKLKEPNYRDVTHHVLYNMERNAFLSGYHKAFAYKAGPCALCKECPAETLENPSFFHKKYCKQPKECRPAMEACGIDVYGTVRRAGFEIHVVRERSEAFKVFGLVLLE